MTTGANEVAIVVSAQDRATRTLQRIGRSLQQDLGRQLRRTMLQMISFGGVAGALGFSVAALGQRIQKSIRDMMETRRAVALLGLQLRQAGFSSDAASKAIQGLRNNVSRLTVQALPGVDAALRQFFITLSPASRALIEEMTDALVTLAGFDRDKALAIALEAATGNMEPFNEALLGGKTGAKDFSEALRLLRERLIELDKEKTVGERIGESIRKAFSSLASIDLGRRIIDQWGPQVIAAMAQLALMAIAALAASLIAGWEAFLGGAQANLRFIQSVILWVFNGLAALPEWLKAQGVWLAQTIWGGVSTFFTDTLPELFTATVKGAVQTVWAALTDWMQERGKDLGRWIGQGFTIAGTWLIERAKEVISLFSAPWLASIKDFEGIGKAIVQGIWDGMNSLRQWIWERVREFIDSVRRAMEGALGIGSPSRVTMEMGKSMAQGLVMGMQSGIRQGGVSRHITQPLELQIGGRSFGRAILEVVDDSLRLREPGLGLT